MLLAIGVILYVIALVLLSFRMFLWVVQQFPPFEQPFITRARTLLGILFAGGIGFALASLVVLFVAKWYVALLAIALGPVGMRSLARLFIVVFLKGPARTLALRIMSGNVEPGLFEGTPSSIGPDSHRYEQREQVMNELLEDRDLDKREDLGEE